MPNTEPKFMRIDARMVHGQIVVTFGGTYNVRHILVVDGPVARDPFMRKFLSGTKLKGMRVHVLSPQEAWDKWAADDFAYKGGVMIIFPSVKSAHELFALGFPMRELCVGNQPGGQGRRLIATNVYLTEDEVALLGEMNDSGVRVYAQVLPSDPGAEFKDFPKA